MKILSHDSGINVVRSSLLALFTSTFLAACGGGSGGGTPTPTAEPTLAPTPTPTAVPTATPTPTPEPNLPLTRGSTDLGSTVIAEGDVTVLLSDGNVAERNNLNNFTLYTFAPDVPGTGQSVCEGACIDAWPPLLAGASDVEAPPYTIVERSDGNRQWAMRDKPLYFFVSDTAAGDITGQRVNDVWLTAKSEPVVMGELSVDGSTVEALVGGAGLLLVNDGSTESRLNKEGFALYTFANDVAGQPSNCDAGCLAAWPALMAESGDVAEAPFSLIEHPDSNVGMQWAYRGMPLYFRAADANAATGVVNAAWPLLKPIPFQGLAGGVLTGVGEVEIANVVGASESVAFSAKHGYTLYTFASDTAGQASTCVSEACLNAWPALMASEGAEAFGPFTLISRTAGGMQWALEGLPLYFRAADTAPGQNNENAAWPAARIPAATTQNNALVANGTFVDGSSTLAGRSLYFRTADTAQGTVEFGEIQSAIFDNSNVSQRCLNCHTGSSPSAGMSLDASVAYTQLTGGSNPRVVPFDSANSLLVQKLQGTAPGSRMPLGGGALSQDLIDMVIAWIDNGAPETGVGAPEPCNSGCLSNWPPLLAEPGASNVGNFSIIENTSGDDQWAYENKPLYFFAGDSAAGDTNGVSTAWPLATP